jgi:hypothetical protein
MGDLPDGWDLKDFKKIEIPPEYKGSLGDTFKYIQDKVLKEDDWKKDLEERKKIYRASRSGIDFNSEDERVRKMYEAVQYKSGMDRQVAYMDGSFGVDIEAEHAFQEELHGIVDDMKVKLVDEKKILEGTLNPEYGKAEWELPNIERTENELSQLKPTEGQWKSESRNGCLTTDPIHISTIESNNSACFADLFNQDYPITQSDGRSILSSTNSCSGKLDDCGIEIDAMNESSECTVPMISELTPGMPNEEK